MFTSCCQALKETKDICWFSSVLKCEGNKIIIPLNSILLCSEKYYFDCAPKLHLWISLQLWTWNGLWTELFSKIMTVDRLALALNTPACELCNGQVHCDLAAALKICFVAHLGSLCRQVANISVWTVEKPSRSACLRPLQFSVYVTWRRF